MDDRIANIISWERSKMGTFSYSARDDGRLNPPATGYSDCSGLQYYAYLTFTKQDIGTWTGTQKDHGTLVTTDAAVAKDGSTVIEGDLVFYRWRSNSPDTYDHVEIYVGGGENLSHGGPGAGPSVKILKDRVDSAIANGGSIQVRRYVVSATQPTGDAEMNAAETKKIDDLTKMVTDLHDRLGKIDVLAFNIDGGAGAEGLRTVVGAMRAEIQALHAEVDAIRTKVGA